MGSLADGEGSDKVQDVLVPWVVKGEGKKAAKDGEGSTETNEDTVYHRYYHLFVKDELRELVHTAAQEEGFNLNGGQGKWLRVVAEGWEADNWWIEGEVGTSEV